MRIKLQEPTDLDMLAESAAEGVAAEEVAAEEVGAEGMEEEFVRREDAPLRSAEDSEVVANNINTFLQRVAGFSVAEIDRQITELRYLREELQSEGERVHREITQYARLSQSAKQSTKIITETLVRPKFDSA
jgi:hypothetical protein